MSKDKDYRRMIQSKKWSALRRRVLEAADWMCVKCRAEGYYTPAREVHHIRPVERGKTTQEKERLMFDINNLQALCHECHKNIHIAMLSRRRKIVKETRHVSAPADINVFLTTGGGFFKGPG